MNAGGPMNEDLWLRDAFSDLAEKTVGVGTVDRQAPGRAATRAIRRARRRHAMRVGIPVVILAAIASSAGVAFRHDGSSDRVATAGAKTTLPVVAPPVSTPPSTAAGRQAATSGATVLSQAVTVDGWTITEVPAGQYLTATTPMLADFGPGPTTPGCAGKPATAVEIVTDNPNSITSMLEAPDAVPVPVDGTTGVEQPPAASALCPTELFVLFEPTPGTLIQVATTDTGLAGAEIVANGIRPAH